MTNQFQRQELASSLGYTFKNENYLIQAFTHKSYHYENPAESLGNNEKLEFLGDAVIDLMVSQWLLEKYPAEDEGVLSQKRAFLVKESELARLARQHKFGDHLLLSRGENKAGGAKKPRLLASVLEAFFGAIFLDQGFTVCEELGRRFFEESIRNLDDLEVVDFKTQLQKNVQEKFQKTPTYKLEESRT
jgi:ribonuclease-3